MRNNSIRVGCNVVEVETTISAEPATIWKALTDPAELVRWFPLQARVVPGIGGSMWLSWGDSMTALSSIANWEPEKHLRLVEVSDIGNNFNPTDGDHAAQKPLARSCEPVRAIDFCFSRTGERTTLRVAHSGFDSAVHSDARLRASIRRGWVFELLSLKQYVERHWGTERSVAWVRRILSASPEEIWNRAIAVSGLLGLGNSEELKQGRECVLHSPEGKRWDASIHIVDFPMQFVATIKSMEDSLLRMKLDHSDANGVELNLFLATYTRSATELKGIAHQWEVLIDKILPC